MLCYVILMRRTSQLVILLGIGKVSNKIYDKIRSKSKKGGRYPQFYIISTK